MTLLLKNKYLDMVNRAYVYSRRLYSHIKVKQHLKCGINKTSGVCDPENCSVVNKQMAETNAKPKQETACERILTVGFDDIRLSDLLWVAPLFKKYNARATFNKIFYGYELGIELRNIRKLVKEGHEIGCHTILHEQYIYFDPLFNGQDPQKPDGSGQTPFPSNDDLRVDIGNGFNVFGRKLSDKVEYDFIDNCSWNELTDVQCQAIRDRFSVFKDTELLGTLDLLSHRFLGTNGLSKNSWSDEKGCYTQGVFTGCKTSENHEIWERIFLIQDHLLKEMKLGLDRIVTWSWPGSRSSNLTFGDDVVRYYDHEMTKLKNNSSRIYSSLTNKERSITDVLRSFSYNNTHDTIYPGRIDGNNIAEQRQQFIYNAFLSRKDALLYPTTRTIKGMHCRESKGLRQFESEGKAYNIDKNNNNGVFTSLEELRHALGSGVMAGCLWDSSFKPSEQKYWELILRYCKETGVSVIPKKEAYKVAFLQKREKGNLIYNPCFSNTLINFLPNNDVPSNPDGWIGDCNDTIKDNQSILSIHGEVRNRNYGMPYGHLRYSVEAKGHGRIEYGFIRNNTPLGKSVVGGGDLLIINDINTDSWASYSFDIQVPDIPIEDESDMFEGRGNKIIGIEFLYEGELSIKELSLIKIE